MTDMTSLPVVRGRQMERIACVGLHGSMNCYAMIAWAHGVVGIQIRHFLALFVLKANLPACEKLWTRLDIDQLGILKRALELAGNDILQAVIGYNMVVGAVIFDGDGLLHQSAFFELVAINEGTTESALLIWGEALGEVCIHLFSSGILGGQGIKGRVFVLIIGIVDVLAGVCYGRAGTFLPLSLSTTCWVESGLLLFWLESSHQLAIDETVVHNAAWGPMDGIGPSLDTRCILFVDKHGAGGEHLGSLLVMWPATDVA